jgi:hypothetical protein
VGVAALAICAAAAQPAEALQVIHANSFTFNAAGTASTGFQEFDPSLGTLNSVTVDIDGTFSALTFVAPGQAFTPIVELDALNAGPRGFSFSNEIQFIFLPVFDPGPPASPGHTETIATGFSIDFTFNATTDIAGLVAANTTATNATPATTTAVAQRDDFVEQNPPGPIGINEVLTLSPVNFAAISGFSGGGSMILTYDYTPFVVALPIPATATLFLLGLSGLALLRRR